VAKPKEFTLFCPVVLGYLFLSRMERGQQNKTESRGHFVLSPKFNGTRELSLAVDGNCPF